MNGRTQGMLRISNTDDHIRRSSAVQVVGVLLLTDDLTEVGMYHSQAGQEDRLSFNQEKITSDDLALEDRHGRIMSAARRILKIELGIYARRHRPIAYLGTFHGACPEHMDTPGEPCDYHMVTMITSDKTEVKPNPDVVQQYVWRKSHELLQDCGQSDMSDQKRLITCSALCAIVSRADYLDRRLLRNIRGKTGFKLLRQGIAAGSLSKVA